MSATHAVRDIERMKMKINSEDFRVRPGEKVKLRERPRIVNPTYKSKEEYQQLLREQEKGWENRLF
jgi:hypothetical protein